MEGVRLILGDALQVLPTLEAGSVDAVVTDPPAGISFMGKGWDSFGVSPPARSGYRAHNESTMLANGRGLTVAASAKAKYPFIAFLSSVMRECLRVLKPGAYGLVWAIPRTSHWTATALEDAGFEVRDRITHLFGQGFPKAKSCLKPAAEDWWLVRKPGKGVAPLGIDECRVATGDDLNGGAYAVNGTPRHDGWRMERAGAGEYVQPAGRWPANVVLDEEAAQLLDEQSGVLHTHDSGSGGVSRGKGGLYGVFSGNDTPRVYQGSSGPASRFFFCPKASTSDRCEGNNHPTVKSTPLMEWLIKLVAREGQTVLDPFMGSASTGVACFRMRRNFIGIEMDPGYYAIAERRFAAEDAALGLFAGAP